VTINGVSLTVVNPQSQTFSVAIIPYTWSHTQFQQAQAGDRVNIEFDILGKYVRNMLLQAGHI
jgi:riboflavin synthase